MAPQVESNLLLEPLLGECPEDHEDVQQETTTTSSKDVSVCGKPMNQNVFLNLVLAALYGISGSLWNGTAYAAYLKKLGHDRNGPLGDIEAVSGLAMLLTALPVGYLADRLGRSKVIAAGGILLLITSFLQIGVLEWVGTSPDQDDKTTTALWIMGAIMAFWGIGDGVVNGPCSALFADSTPEGKRSTYYNYLFACYTGASAAGPLVSIVLFQHLGDEWDLYDLRIVIYVGLSIEIFNALLMMLFDDSKALDEGTSSTISTSDDEEDASDGEEEEFEDEIDTEDVQQGTEGQQAEPETSTLTPLQKRQRWIPYIVFAQGLIFAMGSGMTIKFFPLFFKDEVGMSPSQVQIIYVAVPLVMVTTSTLLSKLANSGFGRVQTTLLSSCLGVLCLYCMVFFKSYLDSHPFLLVPIYVMRTSLMNASYPLQESILMDFVPKHVRARWKSLDSVASFGWCGSAAFGGWLSDRYDYTYTFWITAILQTIGIGVWTFLLPLVPRQEGTALMEDTTTSDETAAPTSTGTDTSSVPDDPRSESLREPLLTEGQDDR
jgi:MFS family permease